MRILLGFILALSVSLACDQPYEEVGGYMIGCWYDPTGMAYVAKKSNEKIGVYSGEIDNSFFNKVYLTILDDKLEELTFINTYQNKTDIDKDVESILSKFREKWGANKAVNASDNATIYVFDEPKSNVLDSINIVKIQKSDAGALSVTYVSEKMRHYNKSMKIKSIDESIEKEKSRVKKLENF